MVTGVQDARKDARKPKPVILKSPRCPKGCSKTKTGHLKEYKMPEKDVQKRKPVILKDDRTRAQKLKPFIIKSVRIKKVQF